MKKKILITGSSGFIGSFLVEEALRKEYEVYAGIRKSSSKQFLQYPGLHFFELNFSSPTELQESLKKFGEENGRFDYVIHNAGITKAKQFGEFYTVNYEYTKNLAESLIAASLLPDKFILVSSLASYGPGNGERMEPICVDDIPKPISDYGISKLKAAEYIRSVREFPHLVVHPTGVYGPRDKDFFQFIKLVNKGFEPYVGFHKQAISLVYVKDLARAIVALLPTEYKNCSYLVSDGNSYDKEQIGIEAKYVLKRKTLKVKLPMKLVQMAVKGNDNIQRMLFKKLPFINSEKLVEISSANWLCNSSDIWEHINDRPAFDLRRGVAETIEWYKENKWL